MASYDNAAGIGQIITDSVAAGGLSAATAEAIQSLLTELGNTAKADNVTTNITNANQIAADAQIVIMDKDTSANVTFDANSNVQAMVVGGAGNSQVVFDTAKDVTVQLGGGENDSVSTGAGDDTITFAGGSATIDTGAGNDVVVLQGEGNAHVTGGAGDMVIDIQTDSAAATIDAGTGFDRVNIVDSILNHVFQFINGRFQMHSEQPITMDNVNVVTFGDGDGINAMTVLADSQADAMVASLYKIALGRYGIDNGQTDDQIMGGIKFWTEEFDQGQGAEGLQHTVYSFLNCDEFHSKYDNMSATEYVQALFNNLGAANNSTITTIDGMSVADWAARIEEGNPESMYQVAWDIASSQQAVNILGQDGVNYYVAGFDTNGDA